MRTRRLGTSDLELSTIGLGTWAIGGSGWQYGWGPQDDDESIKAIVHAVACGVNWIDTAAVYGLGHSEEVVGRALKEMDTRPIIATKCGRAWNPDGTIYGKLSYESVKQECEESLKRLGIDVIDLYQVHWPDPEEGVAAAWKAIADLVKEGKVRYGGVSNFSVAQMAMITDTMAPVSVQPPYSMLRRDIETEILPYCRTNSIGVLAYSPMQKGLLTGKITKVRLAALPADDNRHGDPRFKEPQFSANLAIVEQLKTIAADHGRTCAQLALAWVLRDDAVTSAITGTRKASQIEETVQAGDWALDGETIGRIDDVLHSERAD